MFRATLPISLSLLLCGFYAAVARADALWTGVPTTPPLVRDVHITGINAGKLFFELRGSSTSRELEKITRIAVDNEPAMTAAEDAFALEKWDDAIANYQKVVRSNSPISTKAWLSDWASRRLLVAADKTGRFDAAVTAYITRLQFDAPGSVARPKLPDTQSTYLDIAANDINSALSTNTKLTDEQRVAMLTFLVDLQRARHDGKAADSAAEKLDDVLAKDPNNPAALRSIGRRHVQTAQLAADRKDWRGAIAEIDANRAFFNDPLQQAEALYLLAESRYQLALAAGAGPATKQGFNEAALSFVRVIANFRDNPDKPHVAQSMLRIGQIEESLSDLKAASTIYNQLIAQFPDDPTTADAKRALQNLKVTSPASSPAPAQ